MESFQGNLVGLKKIIVIAGVLALAFSVGAFMNLFSGFTVEREVIVGPEKFSEPGNLVKASDGGYFVIGSETGIAWATKTDADGKVLWTVEEPAPAGTAAHFLTAAASSDGGVLLCGRRDGFVEKATGRATGRAGLILRLDKDGHEINRIDPYLKDPENIDRLIGTFACSNWGDGFMVSGGARVADKSANGSPVTHGFPTILRLNGNGTLLWQKNMDGDFNKPLPQSNGDIIFLGAHGEDDGDKGFLTRIDRDGNILKVVKYPSSLIDLASRWVGSSDQDRGLQILSYPANIAAILEIGPDLQITKKVEFDLPDGMGVSKAYNCQMEL